jgi:hypothetical protein
VLGAEVGEGLGGAPEEDIGGVGADVLGVAVDAAFGDVDLAAALDLGEWGGGGGEGLLGGPGGCGCEENCGGGEEFAAAGLEELRGEDEGHGAEDEEGWDVAKVLAHADAHRGAEPAADGVDPAGLTAALGGVGDAGEQCGIGDQRDGVERDADGVEERGQQGAVGGLLRIAEQEAGGGEGEEGGGEGRGEAAATEELDAGECGGEVEDAVEVEVGGALPGAGFEGGGALDDEEGCGVQPDERGEGEEDEGEGGGFGGRGGKYRGLSTAACGLRSR